MITGSPLTVQTTSTDTTAVVAAATARPVLSAWPQGPAGRTVWQHLHLAKNQYLLQFRNRILEIITFIAAIVCALAPVRLLLLFI